MGRRTKQRPDALRAVGYVRVSTEEQGLGPEAQRAALASWAKANGVTLAAVHEDLGISGKTPADKRDGLVAALRALKETRAGIFLVAKRDRLARDTMIALAFERRMESDGVRVASADGSGNGESPEAVLLRRMMDAFAEYERALIRARTRVALAVKKARGERTGAVPFGHRAAAEGGRLEPDQAEQATLARMRQLRAEGLTYQRIAAQLEAEGHRARGVRWHVRTVFTLLQRTAAEGAPAASAAHTAAVA